MYSGLSFIPVRHVFHCHLLIHPHLTGVIVLLWSWSDVKVCSSDLTKSRPSWAASIGSCESLVGNS